VISPLLIRRWRSPQACPGRRARGSFAAQFFLQVRLCESAPYDNGIGAAVRRLSGGAGCLRSASYAMSSIRCKLAYAALCRGYSASWQCRTPSFKGARCFTDMRQSAIRIWLLPDSQLLATQFGRIVTAMKTKFFVVGAPVFTGKSFRASPARVGCFYGGGVRPERRDR
jgi:hypothetical protein